MDVKCDRMCCNNSCIRMSCNKRLRWSRGSVRVQTRPKPSGFFRAKKSSARRGSKAVGPMSQICGM